MAHAPRTRVKICGITNPEDALLAVAAGADAIGLVFYEPSPRAVDIEQAKLICAALPPFVTVVALVVDEEAAFVKSLLSQLPIHVLQFHGAETAQFCEQFEHAYIKAIRMRPDIDLQPLFLEYSSAQALLLDAYRKGVPGGTGEIFDWQMIPQKRSLPIILAGGLAAVNVQSAIIAVEPYAVDVSGGVEKSHGIKDTEKLTQFMHAVSNV